MMTTKKETFSFVLIFSGLLVAVFGASEFGSFIITDIVFNKILNTNIDLGTIDLVARFILLVIGFFIAGIGVVIFRKVNKNKQ